MVGSDTPVASLEGVEGRAVIRHTHNDIYMYMYHEIYSETLRKTTKEEHKSHANIFTRK